MSKQKKRKKKIRSAQEKALFVGGLFRHKVEKDKSKFNRKKKHKKRED